MGFNLNTNDIIAGKVKLGSTNITSAFLNNNQLLEVVPVPGEVYTNTFNDTSGLTFAQAAGTVTVEAPIGTIVPEVSNALTLEYTSTGNNIVGIDLGQSYEDKLYVQYYSTVVDKGTATNYVGNFEVGQAIGSLQTARVMNRHASPDTKQVSIFANTSTNGYSDTGIKTVYGNWLKIGLEIDKVNLTCKYYINNELTTTISIPDRETRYITFGSTGGTIGTKLQFAALSINTLGFQDIISNSNGVGNSQLHFVDYSSTTNTNYNGVDLSALDKSTWSGLHTEPFDPDGGTNYIDGPTPYLYDIAGTSGDVRTYSGVKSKFFLKRGVTHKIESLGRTNQLAVSSAGNYSSTIFNTLDAYGTGDLPNLDMSMLANPNDWTVFDAPNNIYRIAVSNSQNCTGIFQENNLGLREVFDVNWMTNQPGCWFADSTHVYARLWDETDPSLQDISLSTNQSFSVTPYSEIRNIRLRHGGILLSDNSLMENCELTLGAGPSITNATYRDNFQYDNWIAVDYGTRPTNVPEGEGYGGSGGGGMGVNEGALVYRNKIYDSYLAVNINSDAHDAVFAFNEIRNTIVNSITVSGIGTGDIARRALIANNTVFCGGRHIPDDIYPLTRPQPNHGFVHQNGGGGAFTLVNNLFLIHYNENTGFSGQNNNSTTNIMSFVTNSLSVASGRHGYNKFYITPISTTPAVIFNLGAGNDIATWRTTLGSAGDFKDIDGVSDPDTTSSVETTLPVVQADYTAVSGKWLTIDPTPTVTGGGLDIDYASLGITTDLAGNPITSTKNIGAY